MAGDQPHIPPHPRVDEEDFEDSAVIGGRRGVIGKYQLCFRLASGGMARVYLARIQGPAGFEKLVALKRIHSHLADQPEFIEMFLDEARIASRINHPNICQVFDFGQDHGAYYISMEFLLGETAGRVAGALNKEEEVDSERWGCIAARIVAEAAEGLHAAHELKGDKGESMKVVHRDVSPHNIFVTYDGAVKVVDFGIASAANRLHTTNEGTLKGRWPYMAPEQIQGGKIDRRVDIWALGVTLWEMLTRRRLFKRKNDAETIMAVVYGRFPTPSEVVTDLPKELDAVVMKALERDPERRFQTAREMGQAINQALTDHGKATGNAEISDLMGELFADRRERRTMMIEQARTMQSGVIHPSPVEESAAEELESAEAVIADVEAPKEATQRRAGLIGVVLGVVGGVLATLLLTLAFLGGDETPEPTTSQNAPPPETTVPIADEEGPDMMFGLDAAVAATDTAPPEPQEADAAVVATAPTKAGGGRRRRGMRRAAPAARGPAGTVSVVTPGGWADIYHRGRRLGRTPARVDLPPGRQVLKLRPFGNQPARNVVVQVPAGGSARATLRVQR
jgi:serine/threonine-protein kinase